MRKPTGRCASISTTEPTFRSRIISAISRTDRSGGAVTTVSVMTSRMSTAARVYNRSPVAALTPAQHARVRRLVIVDGERLIGILTLDDIASRTGDHELASQLSARVTRAVMPDFFFHERGDH